MYLCMKTTIDIPDDLMIRAKKRAVELRKPLRELVIEGLREQLRPAPPSTTSKKKTIRWVTHQGGLPPDINLSDRSSMQKLFQK